MSEYLRKIVACLVQIENEERERLDAVSRLVADTIKSDGLIFTFGCGHSHLPGLDAFYRAGGLANVSPMLDTDLMLHNGAAKSSRMEKMSGIASEIFRRYTPSEKDMIFIFSASGKNQVPIEMAQTARAAGVKSVGVSAWSYIEKGGKLHKNVDIAIDCKVPYGDACMEMGKAKMGGLSTYAACFILNTCLINGAKIALQDGVQPPVYLSGNIEGGREHNITLENLYMGRVKHL
ncbi:MAG: sugar isomerase domain-containing protein [Clostridiales bacterium]|nr:sugar isomerase domain-containing protein [Clostridiales bacterium]